MPRPVRFKKQHKPIGFGDPYDPRSVEGYRNAVSEAVETRRYNRTIKALEAQREAAKPLHIILCDKFLKMIGRR